MNVAKHLQLALAKENGSVAQLIGAVADGIPGASYDLSLHRDRLVCYTAPQELRVMTVSVDAEMQRLINEKVASGQYATPRDVLMAALAALQLQDSYGDFKPGELDALLAEGERSIETRGGAAKQDVFARIRQKNATAGGPAT